MLEAWDAGKPVVVTDAVRLVDTFKIGITFIRNSDLIAWSIIYVLDRLSRNLMGEASRHIRSLFAIPVHIFWDGWVHEDNTYHHIAINNTHMGTNIISLSS